MRQRSLTLILAGMCVPALTLSVAAVQPAKQHSFSFNTMFPTMEGKIKYQVYTTIPVYEYYIPPFDSKPEIQTPWEPDPYPSDPPPSVPVLVSHNIQVTTQTYTPKRTCVVKAGYKSTGMSCLIRLFQKHTKRSDSATITPNAL